MKIKAIILDIGGIIIKEEYMLARELVGKKFNFDSSIIKEHNKKYLTESYKGKLDAPDYFKKLIQENNIKATPEEMTKAWQESRRLTSTWVEENKKLLEKLNKNYITISLTNSTKLNDSIQIRKDVYKLFKENIVSHEVGARKPEIEIYQIVLKKLNDLNIKPEEALFVDDKEENLLPAKSLGINTLSVEDGELIEEKLTKFGVKI